MYTPYNSNLAYNFDIFDMEEANKRRKEKQEQKPNINIVKNVAARNGSFIQVLAIAVLFAGTIGLYVISKAEVSLLSTKINESKVLLQEAIAENDRLQSDLDNLYTLNNVEEYAVAELGLEKVKKTQEIHVMINIGGLTEVVTEKQPNHFVTVENWFNDIMEYLGFR